MTPMQEKQSELEYIDVFSIVRFIMAAKRYIVLGVILGVILASVKIYRSHPTWISESTFTVALKQGSSLSPSMSSLLAFSGANISGEGEFQYIETILSNDFLNELAHMKWQPVNAGDSMTLYTLFGIDSLKAPTYLDHSKLEEVKIQNLRQSLVGSIKLEKVDKTGVISFSIETTDPLISEGICWTILTKLESYYNQRRLKKVASERSFLEGKYNAFSDSFNLAQNRLRRFSEENQNMSSSPRLTLEMKALESSAGQWYALMSEFRKQHELAKLDEERKKEYFTIMNEPSYPIKQDKPKRKLLLLLGFFLGGCFGFVIYLMKQLSSKLRYQL
jgi:uncharacterized protein involved in exopolysaccharide biosynthesis